MNPLENYGGMTYQDFMLNPLADALNAIITSTTTVDFAMQVATMHHSPCAWAAIGLRPAALSNRPADIPPENPA